MLISGDHLLGRVSLYYDYGWTPDPAGEFLTSLDKVGALDARLCLSGHGRPFTDVAAHVKANRALVGERLRAAEQAIAGGPRPAVEIVPEVHGEPLSAGNARLVAVGDAVLPDPPGAGGAGAAQRHRSRAMGGGGLRAMDDAHSTSGCSTAWRASSTWSVPTAPAAA